VWGIGGQAGHHQFNKLDVLGLANVPILGPLIFNEDAFVCLSWFLALAVLYYLYRTRPGLYLRAVGENPASADAMGINATGYRYVHTLIGGEFAGLRAHTSRLHSLPSGPTDLPLETGGSLSLS